MNTPKISTKRIISLIIGIPATILVFSELNLNHWYLPFVGLAALVLILKWNGLFDEEIRRTF
jgi:hypothetical protein